MPRPFKASTRLLLAVSLLTMVSGTLLIATINWRLKRHALEEARVKARILLDRNLATHTYFSHQLKPVLFQRLKDQGSADEFEPAWMSSTYAVRAIDGYYQALAEKGHYYKEAAVNARSPENEADPFEREFIARLNQDPGLVEQAEVRILDRRPFFVVLRRGETMEASCLRCHSTPEAAPAEMVRRYGAERSFQRTEGEVVSAVSIRIPLEAAWVSIHRTIVFLSVFLALILLVVMGLTIYLGRRWVFGPLEAIRSQVARVHGRSRLLGAQIDPPASLELADLTSALNALSAELRGERDLLESRVAQRTEDLDRLNRRLAGEVEEHKRTISALEASQGEIKTLRGILPLCAHCKNIRNDQGYWDQIETYIQTHSDADISHGICPDCARKHYPDYGLYDE